MKKNSLEIHILKMISEKNWPIGFKIPTEQELIRSFSLSKATVRKIIQKMVNKEILFSIQGKGVFVSQFYQANKETSLKDELVSDKVIYLPTNYKIPKEIYDFSPFETMNEINSDNSFQFIKIYFLNDDVQAYSINWMIDNNYTSETIDEYIKGERTLFEEKIFEKVYHVHLFRKAIPFDKKLLRINDEFIPTSFAYFIDGKNNILMVRIYKTNQKYFKKEQLKIIK